MAGVYNKSSCDKYHDITYVTRRIYMTDTQQRVNPLLERVKMPGETFTLPSGGLFYNDGELSNEVRQAEVHVHPMTAIDEITIKTPDLLFSGEAVKQVFERCIPSVLKPDRLLAKDVDFLLLCLRKVSYGDTISLEHKHDCPDAKEHSYQVDVGKFIRDAKRIDPTTIASKFSIKMPNDQVVQMMPIRFKQFVEIMQVNNPNEKLTPKESVKRMAESVSEMIVKVDDIVDKEMIREWLVSVKPTFISEINDKIDNTMEWGPEYDTTVECKDCGNQTTLTAPMNPLYFFT